MSEIDAASLAAEARQAANGFSQGTMASLLRDLAAALDAAVARAVTAEQERDRLREALAEIRHTSIAHREAQAAYDMKAAARAALSVQEQQ